LSPTLHCKLTDTATATANVTANITVTATDTAIATHHSCRLPLQLLLSQGEESMLMNGFICQGGDVPDAHMLEYNTPSEKAKNVQKNV
jgi:hypothetical protein